MFAMSRISNGCYSPEHEEGDEQRVVASSLVSLNRRKQRAQGITHHRLRVQYPLAKIPSALRIGWMPLLWSRKKLTPGYLPFTSENWKFQLKNQMFCAIPLEVSENQSCDSEWCNFSTLVSLFSWFEHTLWRVVLPTKISQFYVYAHDFYQGNFCIIVSIPGQKEIPSGKRPCGLPHYVWLVVVFK